MTNQAQSLAERLMQAGSPRDVVKWASKDGYYVKTCRVSEDDVHDLLGIIGKRIVPDWTDEGDEGLELDPAAPNVDLLPVTAWRALADLRTSQAVEPLVEMLCEMDNEADDWAQEELPHVFGKVGKPAIAAIVRLARDESQQEFVRSIGALALHKVAEYHPETRDEVVAHLTKMMVSADQTTIDFNSTVLVGLEELTAVEAAEPIERAFANRCLDVGVIGDWEDVRRTLGVQGLGLEMPEHPFSSLEQFRIRMGVGIFSEEPIFGGGNRESEAESAYLERAWNVFSKSPEAQEVVDRFGRLNWFRSLLEFGVTYRGAVVDAMTVDMLQEFVWQYVPRKVSTEPEEAEAIIFELAKFWQYVGRVFNLPHAHSIVEWLNTDGLSEELKSAMSDPANYGMAKSMVMAGMEAGFDMGSEEGMAEFMAAYNASLDANDESTSASSSLSGRRVGRNDPCPCGSGKKYKKCCRRR